MEDENFFDQYSISSLKDVLEDEFDVLLNAYRADVLEKYQQIGSFYTLSDTENLLKSIHTLKGTSGNIGAIRFSLICEKFEESVRQDNPAIMEEYYQMFVTKKGVLLANIDALLNGENLSD